MRIATELHIAQIEGIDNGVIITYDDGKTFLYEAKALRNAAIESTDLTDVPAELAELIF